MKMKMITGKFLIGRNLLKQIIQTNSNKLTFMRKFFALLCLFSLIAYPAISANAPISHLSISIQKTHSDEVLPKKMSSLKVRDIEKIAGRKLILKEKIAFLILKKKLKHQEDSSSREGKTAFSFGLAAVTFLILGLFVPYVILGALVAAIVAIVMGSSAARKNPKDRKAHSAKLLGWITLGIIALLILLIALVIAAWAW
jgi:hypothetical protein